MPDDVRAAVLSADDAGAVAAMLDQMRAEAVEQGRGVMLSWENAEGLSLVLRELIAQLAAPPALDERPEPPAPERDSEKFKRTIDSLIIARVDALYRGALVISFKPGEVGYPNTPATVLYRSQLLELLGVDEERSLPDGSEERR